MTRWAWRNSVRQVTEDVGPVRLEPAEAESEVVAIAAVLGEYIA